MPPGLLIQVHGINLKNESGLNPEFHLLPQQAAARLLHTCWHVAGCAHVLQRSPLALRLRGSTHGHIKYTHMACPTSDLSLLWHENPGMRPQNSVRSAAKTQNFPPAARKIFAARSARQDILIFRIEHVVESHIRGTTPRRARAPGVHLIRPLSQTNARGF